MKKIVLFVFSILVFLLNINLVRADNNCTGKPDGVACTRVSDGAYGTCLEEGCMPYQNNCTGKPDGATCTVVNTGAYGTCLQNGCMPSSSAANAFPADTGSNTSKVKAACFDYFSNNGGVCGGAASDGSGYCWQNPDTGVCDSDHSIATTSINSASTSGDPAAGGIRPNNGDPVAGGNSVNGKVIYPDVGLADPSGGIAQILSTFLSWLLGIFGILALISFVISGSMYLLAAGSDDMIKRAKATMEASIIGVIIALSGFILIRAIDAALNASSML